MARKKNVIDEYEIVEIIDLYIEKELKGIVSKLSNNGVCNFNKVIANNPEYIRKNGELFKLYRYNVWGGKYKEKDGLGKVKIQEKIYKNSVKLIGENFRGNTIDIVQLVNDLHKQPEKLAQRLCRLFEKERSDIEYLEKKLSKLQNKNSELEEKIEMMNTAMTNFVFQSESAKNSLINMLEITKREDAFCFNEFSNMFNNNQERINYILENVEKKTIKDDIIYLHKKTDKEKYSRL